MPDETLSADELVGWLTTLFEDTGSDVQADPDIQADNTVTLTLSDYYDNEPAARIRQLEEEIESKGWYVTSDGGINSGQDPAEMWFHKTASQEVDVPRYVYHVTPAARLEKVMATGLQPARGGTRHGFKYPARVFVSRHPESLTGMDLGFRQGLEMVILRIDTSAVPDLTLYADPQFPTGESEWSSAYADTAIPPGAIEVEKRLTVEGLVLLRTMIREALTEGRARAAEDPGDDAPEYESVDAFALSKDDEGGDSFTHLDLQALARRKHGVPSPSPALVHAIRKDLEAYGLKLTEREPPRNVRGVTSSVNGRHPFAGAGGGGSGFSSSWGDGGFTSFGGGPGAIGGGYVWDPKDPKNLGMGSKRR